MEAEEQRYADGFNHGYLLAKHEPDLAAQLTSQSNGESTYLSGLLGGKQQYENEVQEWAKGFSRGKTKDSPDLGKER